MNRCQPNFSMISVKWDVWVDLSKFIGRWWWWRVSEWLWVWKRGKSKQQKCGTPIVPAWSVSNSSNTITKYYRQSQQRPNCSTFSGKNICVHIPSRETERELFNCSYTIRIEWSSSTVWARLVCVSVCLCGACYTSFGACLSMCVRERERVPEPFNNEERWVLLLMHGIPWFFLASVRLTDAFARVCVWYLLSFVVGMYYKMLGKWMKWTE